MGAATLSRVIDPSVRDSLAWYLDVAENRRPAKFLIASTLPAKIDPASANESALWDELDRLTPCFVARWEAIREGAALPEAASGPSLLELCRELAHRMLAHCNFCRWDCRVDRREGRKFGACKLGAGSRVSTHFHHRGEELFYRGTEGSGTIFFTSCNMRCAFCQNGDISTDKDNGEEVDAGTLAAMAWMLRREGCHNINWVGGEVVIHLHTIVDAIALLGRGFAPDAVARARAWRTKADGLFLSSEMAEAAEYDGRFNAPMLWNSNFFMTPEAMKILRVLIDVWLPDLKFGPGRCAMTLAKTPWYWKTVTGNIALLREWGEDFTIRHLIMPNHVECCTWPVLEWIAERVPGAPVNVMPQFHPDNFCDPGSSKYRERYEEIARRPMRAELDASWRRARELGLNFEAATFDVRRGVLWCRGGPGERIVSARTATADVAKDKVLVRFRRALEEMYGDRLERVVLFGSRARGDAHADSDYDIAVFLKDMPDRWAEIKRLAKLNIEFLDQDVFFDAKPYLGTSYTERTPLMGEIRRDGIDV